MVAVEPDSAAAEKGHAARRRDHEGESEGRGYVAAAVTALNEAKADKSRALLLVRRGDAQRFVALSFS